MQRRMRNNGFCTNVDAFTSYGMSGAACGGTLAGLRCGRLRPARLEESNNGDCKSFARTGCDRPTSTTLLCHSERSGSTNAASAEAACGLCRARRRKTNEVQSRIYSGQGYRCFAALNMTVAAALRKEVNDKRSAVKNLSTYTFIQILRRSSDLLRMTMLSLH